MPGSPTIIKRRFVESYPFQKLFELYIMKDSTDPEAIGAQLLDHLDVHLETVDLVVVNDYGHRMIEQPVVDRLAEAAPFLAINTQTNADNRGFNTVSKYPRADFICVSENELRLEARSRTRDLKSIIADVADRLECSTMLITRGEAGCTAFERDSGFTEIPAFTSKVKSSN